MKLKLLFQSALIALLAPACASPVATADEGPVLSIRTNLMASDGYIYGFPIMLMDETRRAASEVPYVCGLGGPVNAFTHKLDLPDPHFRAVVRPNVDTLYSSAFLELSKGPIVLDVPEVKDRFYMMAMLDAWTNNFAAPGTQFNGGEAKTYLITGPNWEGETPDGMGQIQAPTDLVWIIGRTEYLGGDDLEAVNEVQRKFTLAPLNGTPPVRSELPCEPVANKIPPEDVVRALSGEEFFSRLDQLIEKYPPQAIDESKLKKLGHINVGPFAKGEVGDLSAANLKALDGGVERGQKALDLAFNLGSSGAWTPNPKRIPLGDYVDDYLVRGVVSQIGFGANKNEYAVYQNAKHTGDGDTLNGAKGVYELRFEDGNTPPVNAFWSVTVYNSDGFLSENTIDRYALGSNSDLVSGADGDIVITFATNKPAGSPEQNWLPVPDGPFEVTLRMYWPEDDILTNRWSAPPVTKR